MKHVTYSDKSLLVGDEAADLLLRYAALLAAASSADNVEVNAIGADGNGGVAPSLPDAGAPLMAETPRSEVPEPETPDVTRSPRERTPTPKPPTPALPAEPQDPNTFED